MNETKFYADGEEKLSIKDTGIFRGPGSVCPSAQLHIETDGNIGLGEVPLGANIETASQYSMTGGLPFAYSVPIYPIKLVPEGGICRVEAVRQRQRCTYCGQMSWKDETIRCENCQSQVFEDV